MLNGSSVHVGEAAPAATSRPRPAWSSSAAASSASSVAYHLAERGWTDVVLLERKRLTSRHHLARRRAGRAAPGHLQHDACWRSTRSSCSPRSSARPAWAPASGGPGSILLARTEGRLEEVQRSVSMGRLCGVDVEMIDAGRGRASCCPLLDPSRGRWAPPGSAGRRRRQPDRRHAGPRQGAPAWAAARIFEHTKVTAYPRTRRPRRGRLDRPRATSPASTSSTAPACGRASWAARTACVIPLHAAEHFYLITERDPGPRPGPAGAALRRTTRPTSARTRASSWSGSSSPGPSRGAMDGIPEDFAFVTAARGLGPPHARSSSVAARRVPAPRRGRHPAVLQRPRELHARRPLHPRRGARAAAATSWPPGSTRSGFAVGGGAGRAVADWIVDGRPPMDLWEVDIRRFMPFQAQPPLPPRPHDRDPGPALRHALAVPPVRDRRAACAARRSTTGWPPRGACFGEVGRLGARELVRAGRRRAALRVQLRPPELVPLQRRGAPRRPRGRRPVRPDVVRQDPASRAATPSACSAGSAPTTSTWRPGGSSTRSGSTSAAASRRT